MITSKQNWLLSSLMGSLLLAGCSLAPEYQPAKVIVPVKFKESDPKLKIITGRLPNLPINKLVVNGGAFTMMLN